MPYQQFLLLYDAIEHLEEDRNWKLVSVQSYASGDEKIRKNLHNVLFPVSGRKRSYWDYNDNGEGIRALRALSRR